MHVPGRRRPHRGYTLGLRPSSAVGRGHSSVGVGVCARDGGDSVVNGGGSGVGDDGDHHRSDDGTAA